MAIVAFALLALPAAHGQPAFQVKDLNTVASGGGESAFPLHIEFVELQGVTLFVGSDGIHGRELWRSDGTVAGTRLVKDVCPGACSSLLGGLTVAGSQVFFSAHDGAHGFELWKTNGTTAGTVLVKDLTPGLAGSWIFTLQSVGSAVLVYEFPPPSGPGQWWRSDGTEAGTVPLANVSGGVIGRLGETLFLASNDPAHGQELWKTDGTDAGTVLVKDIRPGTPSSSPGLGAAAGGKLFFTVQGGPGGSPELWTTDGTEAGTVSVSPIASAFNSLLYEGRLTAHGSEVFFPAFDISRGLELWKSDGTLAGTGPVKDVRIGASGSFPDNMTSSGGKLFFTARDGTHGNELWVSDGTEAGTVLVEDIRPGSAPFVAPSQPAFLTDLAGRLVFFADDGTHGIEPWVSDGTAAGTFLLADIAPGASPSYLVGAGFEPDSRLDVSGGRIYFSPHVGPEEPEIWTTDGTSAGTGPLLEIDTQTSSFLKPDPGVRITADLDGVLVFQASDGVTGFEPWRSDGTAAGTSLLVDAITGPQSSFPDNFTRRENTGGLTTLFRSLSDSTDETLWKTHGSAEGTIPIWPMPASMSELTSLGVFIFFGSDIGLWRSDTSSWGPTRLGPQTPARNLERVGDLLFYTREDTDLGIEELWKVEGWFNTSVVRDLASGGPVDPEQLTAAGSLLFFTVATGGELWKSDGTSDSTLLVKGAGPEETFQIPWYYDDLLGPSVRDRVLAPVGSDLLFVASDGVSGYELWKSDGTTAGTVLLKDIFPGARGSEPLDLTAVGNRVYFVADDGVHGRELWVSDGTAGGTRRVGDFHPGAGSSLPEELSAFSHVLLFSATDGAHGREAWRSNGTAGGTRRVTDVAPDAVSSSPFAFTPSGANVYFAANDGATGFELWGAPKPAFLVTFSDVPMNHWAWEEVEAVAAAGITQGCTSTEAFCPDRTLTRAEVAVFLGRADHGPAFVPPPATGTRFNDVPASHWAASWIEQIAADGITQGCGATPPLFCPNGQLSRTEMAIFLLRAKHGGGYTPPPATGTRFEDVPATYWAASWIEQLAAEGISLGCTPTRFCPGNLVTRAEMAVFLTRTFGLAMP